MTAEEIERIKLAAFVAGYVEACREWTSGCLPAVTLAHKAFEKRKNANQPMEVQKS